MTGPKSHTDPDDNSQDALSYEEMFGDEDGHGGGFQIGRGHEIDLGGEGGE